MHMVNSLEVWAALEKAPREQGLLVLECLLRRDRMTRSQYLL